MSRQSDHRIIEKIAKISPLFGPIIFEEMIADRNISLEELNAIDIINILKAELCISDSQSHPIMDMLLSVDVANFQFDCDRNLLFLNDFGELLALQLSNHFGEKNWRTQLWSWLKSLGLLLEIEELAYKVNVRQQTITELNNFSFNCTQTPILNGEKVIIGTQLILQDISLNEDLYLQSIAKKIELLDEIGKRQNAEQKLEQSQLALVESEKLSSLGVMASHISHEILNPLTIAILKLDSVKRAIPAGKATLALENLQIIERVLERMGKIIKGLRNFSRKDDQDSLETCNFKLILDDALLICGEQLKNKSIEFIMEGQFDAEIKCRSGQIAQVLINLIRNAMEAIEGDSAAWIKIQGHICSRCANPCLEIIISD
jgi:signal transduction histidine kinase